MRFLLVLIVYILVLGCKTDRPPEGILPKDEMIKTLKKIYLIETRVSKLNLEPDSTQAVFTALKKRTFHDLNISDSAFDKSMNYYWDRPEEIREIYAALIDTLNLAEQKKSLE